MIDAMTNAASVKPKFTGAFSAMEALAGGFATSIAVPQNTYDTKVNYRPAAQQWTV